MIIQCNLENSICWDNYYHNDNSCGDILGNLGNYFHHFIAFFSYLVPQLFYYICVRNLCIPDKAWSSGRCSIPYRSLFHNDLLCLALAFSRWSPSFTEAYSAPYSVTVDNSKSKEYWRWHSNGLFRDGYGRKWFTFRLTNKNLNFFWGLCKCHHIG